MQAVKLARAYYFPDKIQYLAGRHVVDDLPRYPRYSVFIAHKGTS
jgi:hypothetical protein